MSVSKQADEDFMRELERTDPVRYANLIRNMRDAAGAESLELRKARGGRPQKYADKAAKQRAYRNGTRSSQIVTKPVAGPFNWSCGRQFRLLLPP